METAAVPRGVGVSLDLCEDRAWLDGYRRGEEPALERVYRAYAPLVFRVIRRGRFAARGPFLNQAAEEEDAVQEVFLQVLSRATRARYDGVRPFANLVVVITRNVVAGRLRKQGRGKEDVVDAEALANFSNWVPGQPLPESVLPPSTVSAR